MKTAKYFQNDLPELVEIWRTVRSVKILSCVPQKTHSQQAMTKVKYVLVPDVK
jgi:hypothetical protein